MPWLVTLASRRAHTVAGSGAPGPGMPAAALAATARAGAALAAVALAAGCSAGQPAQSRATVATCYAFAVQALDQHLRVTSVPPACRGLSHEQINQAVDRAIRTVVGPHRKVVARRLAHKEGAYLSYLVTVVPPRSAAAGAWMLAGWLARGGLRRRYTRVAGVPRAVIIGHFSLALTGLGIWIGFLATGLPALAWTAVGVILSVAGLGMATLASGLPEGHHASDGPPEGYHGSNGPPEGYHGSDGLPDVQPADQGSGGRGSGGTPPARATAIQIPAWAGKPVAIITLHGALAATTILLVVLAAVAA